MPKAKKPAQKSNLEQLQTVAFTVTVGSAVIYGLLWGFAGIADDVELPTWFVNLETVLMGTIVVGGICMGLLYAYRKSAKK